VKKLRGRIKADIEFHGHNDSGCAIANSYAVLEAGGTHIDTSVLGIGERNGITPLGGFIARMYALDRELTKKYNLKALHDLELLVARIVGIDVPFNNYITGITAFTHKAGIHAKAVLNNPETYEILDPHDFGMTRYISIAHRLTGWNAVKNRADQLGLSLTDRQLKEVTRHIKSLADEKALALSDVDAVLYRWVDGHDERIEEPGLMMESKEHAAENDND
jgi:homocitrate synthase